MNRLPILIVGLFCWLGAAWLGNPKMGNLQQWAIVATRPFTLPFLWRSLRQAVDSGDPAEAFARAQALLLTLPDWTDGHAVFAWRYAIEGGNPLATGRSRAAAAKTRLQAAIAMLQAACERTPSKAADLYTWMAFIVELAVQHEPGLAELLTADAGLGAPAQIADRFLAKAEQQSGRASVREQRIFLVPQLCAALLQAADRNGALQVLDAAIGRCAEIRDPQLGQEWLATLQLVRRRLAGDRTVDAATFSDDQRLQPLLPYLVR
jgi:hypothetical protein